jgi:hypothetical protein
VVEREWEPLAEAVMRSRLTLGYVVIMFTDGRDPADGSDGGGGGGGGGGCCEEDLSDFAARAHVMHESSYVVGRVISGPGRVAYHAYHPAGAGRAGHGGKPLRIKGAVVYMADQPDATMRPMGPTSVAVEPLKKRMRLLEIAVSTAEIGSKGQYAITRNADGRQASAEDLVFSRDTGDPNIPIQHVKQGVQSLQDAMAASAANGGRGSDPNRGLEERSALQRAGHTEVYREHVVVPPNHSVATLPIPSVHASNNETMELLERDILSPFGLSRANVDSEGMRHAAGIEASKLQFSILITTRHRAFATLVLNSVVNRAYRKELERTPPKRGRGSPLDGSAERNQPPTGHRHRSGDDSDGDGLADSGLDGVNLDKAARVLSREELQLIIARGLQNTPAVAAASRALSRMDKKRTAKDGPVPPARRAEKTTWRERRH